MQNITITVGLFVVLFLHIIFKHDSSSFWKRSKRKENKGDREWFVAARYWAGRAAADATVIEKESKNLNSFVIFALDLYQKFIPEYYCMIFWSHF